MVRGAVVAGVAIAVCVLLLGIAIAVFLRRRANARGEYSRLDEPEMRVRGGAHADEAYTVLLGTEYADADGDGEEV